MIELKPYKIVWKKRYKSGEHVHYEQYMERDNAETRMDELINTHKVEAHIYYPEKSCASDHSSR